MKNMDYIRFNIKEAADAVGVVPATIRNWERAGLFTSKRSGNNYRYFDSDDIELLRKIVAYSSEGMSISFIKKLVSEKRRGGTGDYSSKLHSLRVSRGLTLTEVSREIGISPSYLSRMEQGKCNITHDALQKLTAFYGEEASEVVATAAALVKKGQGRVVSAESAGCDYRLLDGAESPYFKVAEVYVKPGGGMAEGLQHQKSGADVVFVVKGEVLFTLNDLSEYRVKKGDSISFRAAELERWINPAKTEAQIIWIHGNL